MVIHEQIRQSLRADPSVSLIRLLVESNPKTGQRLSTEFYVAPTGSGLYTAQELNRFMDNLVPDLEPKRTQSFKVSGQYLLFGRLFYDERTTISPFPCINLVRSVIAEESSAFDGISLDRLKNYQ